MVVNQKLLKKFLSEADETVTGDKSAHQAATADIAIDRVKQRMAGMGASVNTDALKGVNTLEQLSIEPFKFNFLLQVPDGEQDLTLPKPIEFDTICKVVNDDPFTIQVKDDNGSVFSMMFDSDELVTNLPGSSKSIKAISVEKFYNIIGDSQLVDILKSEDDGNESVNDYKEGDDITFKTDDGKDGNGKISKIDGETYLIVDKKGGKITINKKNITGKSGEEKNNQEGIDKNANYYNGKDIKEVNIKLENLKNTVNTFSVIKNYKDDPEFQKIFLDSFIDGTKSIKINKKPLLITLKDLRSNGLIEVTSMSGTKRRYLKIKLELTNFMNSLFSLFANLAKNGKGSYTFELIKDFYKQLFFIATKGKAHISDEKTRQQLWKKLIGTFNNFLKSFSKLKEFTKGGKEMKGKNVNVNQQAKATESTTTVESFINDISKYIITEEEKDNTKGLNGKIYVKSITLGPKAKVKRGEDVNSYGRSSGSDSDSGGNILLTKDIKGDVEVLGKLYDISVGDDGAIEKIIKTFVNYDFKNANMIIKQSEKKNGSIIIKPQGADDTKGALVVTPIKPNPNWFKGPIEVNINKNAYEYQGTKPFSGKLLLEPRK